MLMLPDPDDPLAWIVPLDERSKLEQAKREELRVREIRDAALCLIANLGRASTSIGGATRYAVVKGYGFYVIHNIRLVRSPPLDLANRSLENQLTIYKGRDIVFRIVWNNLEGIIEVKTLRLRPSVPWKFFKHADSGDGWTHERDD
ncbi:hypothetical protein JQ609_20535 [Bradyrhizobium sp. AUGA SZCCT0169]|uniref:hypothetical protein n=1 Tax=Bradyrhizobium sp. AUGA SZCCT0169 TaxID=2807663 RepID=UPI001BA9E07C|nr:hypothetical protein [Bradyrhizobium sp. AUGA SZCCT0169]MBR1249302.1 hypothetical protein [Bradyrhizobium sp. AUGA SZCCT0169]